MTHHQRVSIQQEVIDVDVMLDSLKKVATVSTSMNALQKTKIKMIVAQIQIASILPQERMHFEKNMKYDSKSLLNCH